MGVLHLLFTAWIAEASAGINLIAAHREAQKAATAPYCAGLDEYAAYVFHLPKPPQACMATRERWDDLQAFSLRIQQRCRALANLMTESLREPALCEIPTGEKEAPALKRLQHELRASKCTNGYTCIVGDASVDFKADAAKNDSCAPYVHLQEEFEETAMHIVFAHERVAERAADDICLRGTFSEFQAELYFRALNQGEEARKDFDESSFP